MTTQEEVVEEQRVLFLECKTGSVFDDNENSTSLTVVKERTLNSNSVQYKVVLETGRVMSYHAVYISGTQNIDVLDITSTWLFLHEHGIHVSKARDDT